MYAVWLRTRRRVSELPLWSAGLAVATAVSVLAYTRPEAAWLAVRVAGGAAVGLAVSHVFESERARWRRECFRAARLLARRGSADADKGLALLRDVRLGVLSGRPVGGLWADASRLAHRSMRSAQWSQVLVEDAGR